MITLFDTILAAFGEHLCVVNDRKIKFKPKMVVIFSGSSEAIKIDLLSCYCKFLTEISAREKVHHRRNKGRSVYLINYKL
jgi:hypothetical protein